MTPELDMSPAEIEAAVAEARAARARGLAALLLRLGIRLAAALRNGQATRVGKAADFVSQPQVRGLTAGLSAPIAMSSVGRTAAPRQCRKADGEESPGSRTNGAG